MQARILRLVNTNSVNSSLGSGSSWGLTSWVAHRETALDDQTEYIPGTESSPGLYSVMVVKRASDPISSCIGGGRYLRVLSRVSKYAVRPGAFKAFSNKDCFNSVVNSIVDAVMNG